MVFFLPHRSHISPALTDTTSRLPWTMASERIATPVPNQWRYILFFLSWIELKASLILESHLKPYEISLAV